MGLVEWVFIAVAVSIVVIWGLQIITHGKLLEQAGYFNYTNYCNVSYYKVTYIIRTNYYAKRALLQTYDNWVMSLGETNNNWVY